ncbi:MAG: hypothetical protein KKA73_18320 [Chloroflexi bacterium]|nr:hypothetical protein [Chloroflexota bacterium]MBU1749643.1 hypothetical protein [Chloroflexota bacterium]
MVGPIQPAVYLLAWNMLDLGQALGTGTNIVRYVPPALVVLETGAGYAPFQKQWLGAYLADATTYPDLPTALAAARALPMEEP